MIEKKVLLTISSIQRFQSEEPETTKLVTEGEMRIDGDAVLLSYEETELTGLTGTRTSFCIGRDSVTLKRTGSIESKMTFVVGHEDHSLYDTGFGALMIAVRAEEICSDIGENGGTLRVVYSIVIEEETAGMIEYRIEVRPKPSF